MRAVDDLEVTSPGESRKEHLFPTPLANGVYCGEFIKLSLPQFILR